MTRMKKIFLAKSHSNSTNWAILLLRVGTSLLMIPHGWKKLQRFRSEGPGDFYNFIGLDSETSLLLIIIAEFFCSVLLILGIGTRIVLIPLIIGMAVVAFMVHGSDPLSEKEHALLFLIPYLTLFITGPGKYSLDYFFTAMWPGRTKFKA